MRRLQAKSIECSVSPSCSFLCPPLLDTAPPGTLATHLSPSNPFPLDEVSSHVACKPSLFLKRGAHGIRRQWGMLPSFVTEQGSLGWFLPPSKWYSMRERWVERIISKICHEIRDRMHVLLLQRLLPPWPRLTRQAVSRAKTKS